jgi:hypothetical protein
MFSDQGMDYVTVCLNSHPQNPAAVQATPSPMTKLQSGHAATMLQQLIAEADNKAVVFSDDLSVQTREQHLQGLAACQEDNIQHKNCLSKCQMTGTRALSCTMYTSFPYVLFVILHNALALIFVGDAELNILQTVCCAETYIFFPVFTMLSMFKISICES